MSAIINAKKAELLERISNICYFVIISMSSSKKSSDFVEFQGLDLCFNLSSDIITIT